MLEVLKPGRLSVLQYHTTTYITLHHTPHTTTPPVEAAEASEAPIINAALKILHVTPILGPFALSLTVVTASGVPGRNGFSGGRFS